MSNISDICDQWMGATADFMVDSRPDLYPDPESAANDLSDAIDRLADAGGSGFTSFASFVLVRLADGDSYDEWTLTQKASTWAAFPAENKAYAISHVENLGLPGIDENFGDELE